MNPPVRRTSATGAETGMLGGEWRKLQDEMRVLAGAHAAAHQGQADLYLSEADAFCTLPVPGDPDTLLERHSESVTVRSRWIERAASARPRLPSPGRPAVPGPVAVPAVPSSDDAAGVMPAAPSAERDGAGERRGLRDRVAAGRRRRERRLEVVDHPIARPAITELREDGSLSRSAIERAETVST